MYAVFKLLLLHNDCFDSCFVLQHADALLSWFSGLLLPASHQWWLLVLAGAHLNHP